MDNVDHIEVFYLDSDNGWTVVKYDEDDFQVGDAVTVYQRSDAIDQAEKIANNMNRQVPIEVYTKKRTLDYIKKESNTMSDVKGFLEGDYNFEQSNEDYERAQQMAVQVVKDINGVELANNRIHVSGDTVSVPVFDKNGFPWSLDIKLDNDGQVSNVSMECDKSISLSLRSDTPPSERIEMTVEELVNSIQ